MPSGEDYRSIKLEQGQLVDQIKNLTQDEWAKVSAKLGLCVSESNGKGSHIAVYKSNTCSPSDSSCLVLTIPHKLYSQIQRDFIKKLVAYGKNDGKYTEADVWIALGVKIQKNNEPK
ncbi:hypothetical protein A2841_00440 [Candidatus Kaiserbacteria bacterium RIFCSPHIGHO2_01_FULL_48_10]|uniref:Uncharacterized protein n=1 Tax=Candidatus Kaiserbacteria bacterium RIFCSPHIGHO2_01_FULL_48_10 TaxID=1798476 RepID=A0A1F6C670_9BACT|nr:MAG: hypothetical protein A2841_00440 [Candidatus Kaiserbacteria bacterium RIFCSPHIGHO2_01_FULL_48_10]